MAEIQVQHTYKDRLFRMIFSDREKLLELYNAMNGTAYENAEELQIVTLENAIYMAMKNDIAYVFHDELFLYEQQATKNENMPLRCLFYVSDSYSALVRNENIYGNKRIRLPAPTFVVFYNGKQKLEEEGELRLSDAFMKKQLRPNLELIVKVRNINMGNSQELFSKCQSIREYMIFVDKVRRYSEEKSLEEAVGQAIEECLKENIMADFLRKNRAEVMKVCLYEYDEEKQREWDREEGREEGRKEGKEEEREKSIQILIRTCKKFHCSEKEVNATLQEAYGMTASEAEKVLGRLWKAAEKTENK